MPSSSKPFHIEATSRAFVKEFAIAVAIYAVLVFKILTKYPNPSDPAAYFPWLLLVVLAPVLVISGYRTFISRAKPREFFVVEAAGLRVFPAIGRIIPWPEIQSCEGIDRKGSPILRIYLRHLPGKGPKERLKGLVKESAEGLFIDVDFANARDPAPSRAAALRACAEKLSAAPAA